MTASWPSRITAVGEVLISLQAPAGSALATAPDWTVRVAGAEANFAIAFTRAGGRARICTAVGADPPGDRWRPSWPGTAWTSRTCTGTRPGRPA